MKIIDKISELKPKDKKTIILICVAAILVLICIGLNIFSSDGPEKTPYQGPTTSVIPPVESDGMAASKTEAMQSENDRKSNAATNPLIDDDASVETIYNDSISADDLTASAGSVSTTPSLDEQPASSTTTKTPDKPSQTQQSRQDEVNSFFFGNKNGEDNKKEQPAKRPESILAATGTSSSSTSSSDRAARRKQLEDEYTRAHRSPEEIAAEEAANAKAEQERQAAEQQAAVSAVLAPKVTTVRSSRGISSIGSSFGSIGDNSVGSIDDSHNNVSDAIRPIMVRFAQTEKVRSGQRVNLRLMEDLLVNNILIPANTLIPATASMSTDRLNITVTTLQIGGRMFTLNYKAYDTDGGLGLYCPTTTTNKVTKEAIQDATQIGTSAILQRMTGISQRALNDAVSIIRSSGSDSPITVPSGYTFFIMPDSSFASEKW